MINKVKVRMGLLRRGLNFLTTHAKKILFFAQIQNVLMYGIGAWGNMITQTQQNCLQRAQNQGIRLIEKCTNIDEIQKKHKILSINNLTKLENYKLWYQEQNNTLPRNLLRLMREDHKQHELNKTHGYATRNKNQMNLPVANNGIYCSCFLFKGLQDYQLLPGEIKAEKTEKSFMLKCKTNLLTH